MPAPVTGQARLYSGAMDVVRQTVAVQGVRGLYKGMAAPLATVAAFNALLFSAWGGAERVLAHADGARRSLRRTLRLPTPHPHTRRCAPYPHARPHAGSPLTIGETTLAGGIAGIPVSLLATPTARCCAPACAG